MHLFSPSTGIFAISYKFTYMFSSYFSQNLYSSWIICIFSSYFSDGIVDTMRLLSRSNHILQCQPSIRSKRPSRSRSPAETPASRFRSSTWKLPGHSTTADPMSAVDTLQAAKPFEIARGNAGQPVQEFDLEAALPFHHSRSNVSRRYAPNVQAVRDRPRKRRPAGSGTRPGSCPALAPRWNPQQARQPRRTSQARRRLL